MSQGLKFKGEYLFYTQLFATQEGDPFEFNDPHPFKLKAHYAQRHFICPYQLTQADELARTAAFLTLLSQYQMMYFGKVCVFSLPAFSDNSHTSLLGFVPMLQQWG